MPIKHKLLAGGIFLPPISSDRHPLSSQHLQLMCVMHLSLCCCCCCCCCCYQGSLLADALAATTGLRRLNLNDNKLTGTLPDAVSALSNLEALQLATNNLQGTVPAAFAGLSKLKTL
jgi:Leucine-rich repeat (LRR) protein